MFKYVVKRILLMLLTFLIIISICFVLIKLVPRELSQDKMANKAFMEKLKALGYDKPIITQLLIYLKNLIFHLDMCISWEIEINVPVSEMIVRKLPPTILVNVYSLIISVPIGIAFGIFAALKKNKWQDTLISTMVMVFVSVPSFVYAFLLQYFLGFKWKLFPLTTSSLSDAGGTWFSWIMIKSMVLPVLALSFGTIAGLTRFTRAELTETLTSDYMLLARTKGLTKSQAVTHHALKNAMVPILPSIISSFVSILSGSLIIEGIFAIPGIGGLYIKSINMLDYDVFMGCNAFYVFIGLAASIVVDLSYGFIDPRIRMGASK